MAAQTEFARGFIAGTEKMRTLIAIRVLDTHCETPKQEKEE